MASTDQDGSTPVNIIAPMIMSAGLTAASHPLSYVKFLIQIGHEPIAPKAGKSWFGKPVIRLPGFLDYSAHIRKVDGFWGMYRGLTPRILQGVVGTVVNIAVLEVISDVKTEGEEGEPKTRKKETLESLAVETCRLSAAKTVAITCSHPLLVISVRMMAQFVGRETTYRTVFQSIGEIYRSEGISGFFSGLIPHILGELVSLWAFRLLYFFGKNYVLADNEQMTETKEVQMYGKGICQWLAGYLTYPFALISNLMAVNKSGLAAGSPPNMNDYGNWVSCMGTLRVEGSLWRGNSVIYRTLQKK